nr:hypothetical protein Iba_chr05dCG0900 [Ipomoea batatas]
MESLFPSAARFLPSASATLRSVLRRRSPRGPTSVLTSSGLLKNLKLKIRD